VSVRPRYVLGSAEAEVERLDQQAATIAPATALLLRAAGLAPGMRVLDLGTGPGHVASLVAELVGAEGSVLGVDQSEALLAVAESRRGGNMAFEWGDARTCRAAEPFDAIVTRLLLFHLPDAVDVLRHHRENLRPGGLMVAVDYDMGTARAEPPVELAATVRRWVEAGFRAAGADPRIGAAGYEDVAGFGVQGYLQPGERPQRLLVGAVRSLAPQILASGIATEEELGLDTLDARLADAVAAAGAVVLPPCLVDAWAVRS
jgi:protein-L-isoaspartate O-methyltransferase